MALSGKIEPGSWVRLLPLILEQQGREDRLYKVAELRGHDVGVELSAPNHRLFVYEDHVIPAAPPVQLEGRRPSFEARPQTPEEKAGAERDRLLASIQRVITSRNLRPYFVYEAACERNEAIDLAHEEAERRKLNPALLTGVEIDRLACYVRFRRKALSFGLMYGVQAQAIPFEREYPPPPMDKGEPLSCNCGYPPVGDTFVHEPGCASMLPTPRSFTPGAAVAVIGHLSKSYPAGAAVVMRDDGVEGILFGFESRPLSPCDVNVVAVVRVHGAGTVRVPYEWIERKEA